MASDHEDASTTSSDEVGIASADELWQRCRDRDASISDVMLEIELAETSERDLRDRLLALWQAMASCIEAGYGTTGSCPASWRCADGPPDLHRRWLRDGTGDRLNELDRVGIAAMAVIEENAAGGRSSPRRPNGAAGIVPAVLDHHLRSDPTAGDDEVVRLLLAAAAIGLLCKRNASISGAEVGCQGEVGSASAMAADGLAEVLGGSPAQVENAAEIALGHNLGLTCDPISGLVQIPCVERNGIGAVKSIAAARLALRGDGAHRVSLDQAIETTRSTRADMADEYKETSRGWSGRERAGVLT